MSFGLIIKGVSEVLKELEKQSERCEGALGAALYQEGLALDSSAVMQMPVDTGRMRATHYVTPPEMTRDGPVVEVGCGTDYAIYVHEREEIHHDVGGSKFYEIPLNEIREGYAERIKDRASENLAKGVTMVPIQAPTKPKE